MSVVRPAVGGRRVATVVVLLAILGLAGVLRIGRPGLVEFRRDEANLSRLALDMARGHGVALLGIGSSIGVPNPPASVWVMVPPFLLGNDPVLATSWVGFVNVLGVLLLFLFARRYAGTPAALVAAALFAAGPWPVLFSRKIWAQDMLPPLAILVVWTGIRGFLEDRPLSRFLHLPLLALAGQVHYAAIVLVPVSAYLVFARRRLDRPLVLGTAAAVLSFAPFAYGGLRALAAVPWLAGEVLRHPVAGHALGLSAESFALFARAVGGAGATALVLGEEAARAPVLLDLAEPVFVALGLLAVVAAGWLVVRAARRGGADRRVDRALAVWLLAAPLAFVVTWVPAQTHYLIPVLPVAYLAVAILGRDLLRAFARRRGGAAWTAAAAATATAGVVLLAAAASWTLLDTVSARATPGGFGVPLGARIEVRDRVLAARPAHLLVRAGGQDVWMDEETSVWDAVFSGLADVRFVPPGVEVRPAEATLLLAEGCDGPGERIPLGPPGAGGVPRACVRLLRVGPRGADRPADLAADVTPLDLPSFAVGARLVGVRRDASRGRLDLVWRLPGARTGPLRDDFSVGLDLRDAAGHSVATVDRDFWWGRWWRPEDVVTLHVDLGDARPDGAATAPSLLAAARTVAVRLRTTEPAPGGPRVHEVGGIGSDGRPTGPSLVVELPGR